MKSLNKYLPHGLSDQIDKVIRGPHQIGVRIKVGDFSNTIWHQNFGVDHNGWRDPNFILVNGSITESREAVGRTLNMEVASEYWETQFDAIRDLSPYRSLLSVERSLVIAGETIYIPLGVYRVYNTAGRGQAGGGYGMTVTAYSMEADVRGSRFLDFPVTGPTALGNTIKELIPNMLNDAFSGTVLYDDSAVTSELDYRFADDRKLSTDMERLDLIQLLLKDRGVWGHFNRAGVYEVAPLPSPSDAPVWKVNAGPDGVLMAVSKDYHRDGVYNAVVATGENEDEGWTHTYTAYDDKDPTSPTRWDGPYGRVPRFYYSPLLHTEAAVKKAAESMLKEALLVKSGMGFDAVPNPTLEVGDAVEVVYTEDGFNGIERTEHHLIDSLEIGLGADTAMVATTKSDDTTLAELAGM